jgi:hypothetical protein
LERVGNQGKKLSDLRSNMNTGFQQLNAAINTLSNEVGGGSKDCDSILVDFSMRYVRPSVLRHCAVHTGGLGGGLYSVEHCFEGRL